MRYLGEVSEKMKVKEYTHIHMILERETVFRSFKHIINEHLRVVPETYIASVVCHLLNLLLAPFPFLKLLNEGGIAFVDETI